MGLKYKDRFHYHLAFTEALFAEYALRSMTRPEIEELVSDVFYFSRDRNGILYTEPGKEREFKIDDSDWNKKLFPLVITGGQVPPQQDMPFTPNLLYANDTLRSLQRIFNDLRDEENLKRRSLTIPRIGWQVDFLYQTLQGIHQKALRGERENWLSI